MTKINFILSILKRYKVIFLTSFFTIFIVFISVLNFNNYIDSHPFFFDSSTFYYALDLIHHNFINELKEYENSFTIRCYLAINSLKNNDNLTRIFPLILLIPRYLNNINAHLITSIPLALGSLFIIYYTLIKNSNIFNGSIIFLSFLLFPGFIDHKYGLGVFWLDEIGGLLIISSIFSLYNWYKSKHEKWLLISNLLLTLALISRPIMIVNLFTNVIPFFIFFTYLNYRNKEKIIRPTLIYLSTFIFLIIFSFYEFDKFVNYYVHGTSTNNATILNKSPSLSFFLFAFKQNSIYYFSFISLLIFTVIDKNHFRKNITINLLIIYSGVITILLNIFLLENVNAFHVYNYSLMLLSAHLILLILINQKTKLNLISMFLIIGFGFFSISFEYNEAFEITKEEKEIKKIDKEIASFFQKKLKLKDNSTCTSLLFHRHLTNINLEIKDNFFLDEKQKIYKNDFWWSIRSNIDVKKTNQNYSKSSINDVISNIYESDFIVVYQNQKSESNLPIEGFSHELNKKINSTYKNHDFKITLKIKNLILPNVIVLEKSENT